MFGHCRCHQHCSKCLNVLLFSVLSSFFSSCGHSPGGYAEAENTSVKTDLWVISPAHSVTRINHSILLPNQFFWPPHQAKTLRHRDLQQNHGLFTKVARGEDKTKKLRLPPGGCSEEWGVLGAWGKLMRNRCGSHSAQALLGCGHLHVQRSCSGHSRMPSWRVSGLIQS